jgi:lantibiotic modifying enzyme
LLKKGFGLCHGISGNAYSFLKLYSVTKDVKFYKMAVSFTNVICSKEYQEQLLRKPDRPTSLFEGIAGTIIFLVDMNTNECNFPAYDIPEKWKK